MSELRWNPLLRTYTMVAAHRQHRPHLPKDYCPFCPGSGKVPDQYEVYCYPNDFPALSPGPGEGNGKVEELPLKLYHTAAAYGKCEVILYAPGHHDRLYELPVNHLLKLVQLWTQRFEALRQDPDIRYIFPFENKGEEVGVTMHHPHGQLYAYPFLPLKIKTELDSCRAYFQEHHQCLFCAMNEAELADGRRIIFENRHFIAYIPHFTDYPFGVFIVSREHMGAFPDFDAAAQRSLAQMLKYITAAFDKVYDRPFPYMKCIHQIPVNSPEYSDCRDYYHFHIEFYPPLRAAGKVKWYASSEMGAWAAANVMAVEDSAVILREALADSQITAEG